MANENGVKTLEDLGERAFGRNGFYYISMFQILFSLSLMCITLNVWGDIMSQFFHTYLPSSGFIAILSMRRVQVLIGAILVLPHCALTSSIARLRFTPYLTIVIIVVSLITVGSAFIRDVTNDPTYTVPVSIIVPTSRCWTLGFVVPFCFSFNQKVFTVYNCLRQRNSERWRYAVHRALLVTTIIYLAFGLLGYFSFNMKSESISSFNYFSDSNGSDGTGQLWFNITRSAASPSLIISLRLVTELQSFLHCSSLYLLIVLCLPRR